MSLSLIAEFGVSGERCLLAIARDEKASEALRVGAIRALGELQHAPVKVLLHWLEEGQPRAFTRAAILSIGAHGEAAKAAFPALVKIAKSKGALALSASWAAQEVAPADATSRKRYQELRRAKRPPKPDSDD